MQKVRLEVVNPLVKVIQGLSCREEGLNLDSSFQRLSPSPAPTPGSLVTLTLTGPSRGAGRLAQQQPRGGGGGGGRPWRGSSRGLALPVPYLWCQGWLLLVASGALSIDRSIYLFASF